MLWNVWRMSMCKSIAIITARGGSKRIPKKNIKDFCGKPIIAYSIQAARQSGLFDEIMVSTDDAEIAEVSRKYGAAVPFMRSEQNANDFATTTDVLQEVFTKYAQQGLIFNSFCVIYPTAPFVTYQHLQEARTFIDNGAVYMVVTVLRFSFPPQRAFVQENTLIMERTIPLILSEMEVQDIYNEVDWKLAELKYKLLRREH